MKITNSQRAVALLEEFLKLTETGGCFSFPISEAVGEGEKAEAVQREDFVNRVIGVITSFDKGETPLEYQVELCKLTVREMRADLAASAASATDLGLVMLEAASNRGNKMLPLVSKLSEAVSKVGPACDMLLHLLGVESEQIKLRPSRGEERELDDAVGGAGCNCAKCRADRRAKLAAEAASVRAKRP